MKLIELHILQSFPVSCLNRDDVGSPKSAIFGGTPRARLSSQCFKWAIRQYAQDNYPEANFDGIRTKSVEPFITALKEKAKLSEKEAEEQAMNILKTLAKHDDAEKENKNKENKDEPSTVKGKTLLYLSKNSINHLANNFSKLPKFSVNKKGEVSKSYKGALSKILRETEPTYETDIALFGRMVASVPDLTLEGAAMFSHPLSTHRVENDLDFYTAVDDLQKEEETGAGMMGDIEFNSALYYRYAAVNLDLLFDEAHLGKIPAEQRRTVIDTFVRSTLMAVPGARKNSMNANTLPGYVLGLYKEQGAPLQLINAFEKPVWSKNGLLQGSIEALEKHYSELKSTWGLTAQTEVKIPEITLQDFVEQLVNHVQ